MYARLKKILSKERGMIDLGSVMTGVVVTGILGAFTAASFLVIIPWMNDKSATDDITLVQIAQDSYYTDNNRYGNLNELKTAKRGYLHETKSQKVCVTPSADKFDYSIVTVSKSGKKFWYSSLTGEVHNLASVPAGYPVALPPNC